ncbi:MAG: ABC transporter ATP-binding protein/permease [Lachnospiraceae bacterium]|nr:ABC transporter ATP-binding protein/permease [Lachnospiraceae bacterium]
MNVYRRLKKLLNAKQKRGVIGLMVLIFISALLETLGVSAIIPLISAIVSPDKILEHPIVADILARLGMEPDPDAFVRLMLVATMAVFVFKNLYFLLLYRIQSGFVTRMECQTSVRLLSDYLNRPYSYYLNADVNAMIQTINKDIPHVFELLQEVMRMITEIAVGICMCVFLLFVNAKMTLSISVLLFVMVLVILFIMKPKLSSLGGDRLREQALTMKWMQQSFFGIKDVKVNAKEDYFRGRFSKAYVALATAIRKYSVLNNAPRLVIETVGIVGLLAYMLLLVIGGEDLNDYFALLAAFGMAAVRLMPCVTRISTYLSTIAYLEPSLNYVCDNLDLAGLTDQRDKDRGQALEMKKEIRMKGIRFAYPGTEKEILSDADMLVPVGSSVGVIGASGAGKTTVIDILLGLLTPQGGEILADGKPVKADSPEWLANIGYIAQNIYMLDDTIRANVAYGVDPEEIDDERILKVLKEAQMEEFVLGLPQGLDTEIGDRGVRISGGQRQRLGIARALYHDPELLVFDEATSALDNDTEAAIMDAINSLKGRKTMIIIAHRLKTIENCDIVYKVENGKVLLTEGGTR